VPTLLVVLHSAYQPFAKDGVYSSFSTFSGIQTVFLADLALSFTEHGVMPHMYYRLGKLP
jgi:hypothetical protein